MADSVEMLLDQAEHAMLLRGDCDQLRQHIARLQEHCKELKAQRDVLLEVAREIDRFFDGWCPTTCSCAIKARPLDEKLRKAIAKAEEK